MTGDTLNSSISSGPNSTSNATIMIPDGFIRDYSNVSFVFTVFTSDSLFIPNEDDGSTVGTSVLDLTLPDMDVSDLEEPFQLMFPNVRASILPPLSFSLSLSLSLSLSRIFFCFFLQFTPPADGSLVPVCEFWDTENNSGCVYLFISY